MHRHILLQIRSKLLQMKKEKMTKINTKKQLMARLTSLDLHPRRYQIVPKENLQNPYLHLYLLATTLFVAILAIITSLYESYLREFFHPWDITALHGLAITCVI
ncbi:hypothetical protein ACJX0J_030136 [Zea mays]